MAQPFAFKNFVGSQNALKQPYYKLSKTVSTLVYRAQKGWKIVNIERY